MKNELNTTDCPKKNGLTIDPYTTSPAKTRKPLTKRPVATGSPLIVSNSEIFVVMWLRIRIAIIPIARQMMLEIKARTNHSNKEVRNDEGIATDITVIRVVSLKCL